MKVLRVIWTAVRALRRNVMRAILTMLGIVIGIAAVITMMEIGQGASASMQKSIAGMGTYTLMIFSGSTGFGGANSGAGAAISLTVQDLEAILSDCPAVRTGTVVIRTNGQVVAGNRNWSPGQIVGTTPEYLDVQNWGKLTEGEPFTDRDVRASAQVCLIGKTIKDQLFPNESAVGKELRLANVSFKVAGVLAKKGANLGGQDQDDILIAPWTSIKYRVSNRGTATAAAASSVASDTVNSLSALYPTNAVDLFPARSATQQANTPMPVRFSNVGQIVVSARSAPAIPEAIEQITSVLRERHHLREGEDNDFTIRDLTQFVDMLTATSRTMTGLLLCVALISLVVGGVGIMNIMLVSVTERTREIGLRMAVGARGGDILLQFLIEAILLCVTGGVIGICLGRTASIIIVKLLNWPAQASLSAIIASVVVSGTVGMVFGFYPAWRAARLNPIEALRYE